MKSFGCFCASLFLVIFYCADEGAAQAGRYGGPNYRPGPGYNTAVRGGGGGGGGGGGSVIGSSINSPLSGVGSLKAGPSGGTTRPLGVGAFSYGGGVASGGSRPAFGPSFALNSGGHRPQQQSQVAAVVGGVGAGRPQQGGIYRGAPALGRPSGPFQYN